MSLGLERIEEKVLGYPNADENAILRAMVIGLMEYADLTEFYVLDPELRKPHELEISRGNFGTTVKLL